MFLRLVVISSIIMAVSGCGSSMDAKLKSIEQLPADQQITALEELWAENPADSELPNLLSRARWETYGDLDNQAKVDKLKAELRADPEDAVLSKLLGDAYYDLAQEPGNEEYVDSALFAYENAALKAPSFLAAVGSVGAIYDSKEEYDQAIFWYERALTIEPEHVTTLCNIGASYYNRGDYGQAMDYYRQAMAIDPESQDAHYNLGVAFAEASIYREAIHEWEIVVAIDSTTSVGQQAKQNAELLQDVLDETRYRSGKRTRRIDMSGAERRTSNVPRDQLNEDKSQNPDQ